MMNKLLSAFLLSALLVASSQEIGTELCSCSPSSYEFKLDFSLTCPPVNITIGNAIEQTSCLVSPFGDPEVENLVPVAVERVDILELGQSLRVIAQIDIDRSLGDGETFTYESVFANPEAVESEEDIIRALQLNMVGVNSDGDRIVNVLIVSFTNGCGTYPVFDVGASAGWLRFVAFGPASPELCAASLLDPTDAPTARATENPTNAASDAPTMLPSSSPTATPTKAVTDSPTKSPTNKLVVATPSPTKSPVVDVESTQSPTQKVIPPETQTAMPMSMSMSMNMNDLLKEMEGSAEQFGLVSKSLRTAKGNKKDSGEKNLKANKSPKQKVSEKSAKTVKGNKKSSKVQKAMQGEFGITAVKMDKKEFDGVKIVERLRRTDPGRR